MKCTYGPYSVQDNCSCKDCEWRREMIATNWQFEIYRKWPQFAKFFIRGTLLIEYLPHEMKFVGTYPAPDVDE